MNDFEAMDFFRDDGLVADPYPYFEALRGKCPVQRETHHAVMMVTGYDEAVQVFNDTETFSSCISVTGPFPGFPVPLEGDDVSELIELHRDKLPMSDQLPTLDPPVHTDHRALLMRLITPRRLKENEALMWQLADRQLDAFLTGGEGEFISGFAAPFTLRVITDLLGVPAEDREEFVSGLEHRPQSDAGVGSTETELAHAPLEYLYARFSAESGVRAVCGGPNTHP
ncbi:cytochrome P450 [Streptomyces sp. SD15]